MPVLVPMNMSFLTFCALFMLPGWSEIMGLPVAERIAQLRDPETRIWMLERVAVAGGRRVPPSRRLGRLRLGDIYSTENEGLKGRHGRATSPPSAAARRSARSSTS